MDAHVGVQEPLKVGDNVTANRYQVLGMGQIVAFDQHTVDGLAGTLEYSPWCLPSSSLDAVDRYDVGYPDAAPCTRDRWRLGVHDIWLDLCELFV